MKIKEIRLENFRAYKDVTIELDDFNCIVGKNDVGKSTILAALDWFFNDNIRIQEEDFNVDGYDWYEETESFTDEYGNTVGEESYKCVINETTSLSVSICFSEVEINDYNYLWKEFLDENGYIWIEKTADYPYYPYEDYEHNEQEFPIITKQIQRYDNIVSHNTYKIRAKIFNNIDKPLNDFSAEELKDEYIKIGGNPDIFNDLRGFYVLPTLSRVKQEIFDYYTEQGIEKKDYSKQIDEAFKMNHLSSLAFPKFELFKSDITLEKLLNRVFSNEITQSIKERKNKIANLMQQYITNEKMRFHNNDIVIDAFTKDYFEFEKKAMAISNKVNVPISNRGDGFKLKMQYAILRYLSEQQDDKTTPRVFAFEEPETHLHPSAQIDMYDAIRELSNNPNYQVIITTHSPTLVSQCSQNEIIQVVKDDAGLVCVKQHSDDITTDVIKDLGITNNDILASIYDSNKCLFLVEGPDDVKAFTHVCEVYKNNGKVNKTFSEMGCVLIPIGGCDTVKNWTSLKIVQQLHKKFFIVLDNDNGKNEQKLNELLPNDTTKFTVLKKLEIENYIPYSYFQSLNPPISISYGDNDDVKEICKHHTDTMRLGGKKVCDKHFHNLTFEQVRSTFCTTGRDDDDEFLDIYTKIKNICGDI